VRCCGTPARPGILWLREGAAACGEVVVRGGPGCDRSARSEAGSARREANSPVRSTRGQSAADSMARRPGILAKRHHQAQEVLMSRATTPSRILRLCLTLATAALLCAGRAGAQEWRSLSGYSGSMTGVGTSSGGSIIPYAGSFGGFMPARMSGASPLAFQPRTRPGLGSGRAPFSLTPMPSSTSNRAGSMGGMRGTSRSRSLLYGDRMSTGGSWMSRPGLGLPMSGGPEMGVLPPSFAYPFYWPPSFSSALGLGPGMSM